MREEECHVHNDIFLNNKYELYELRNNDKNYIFSNYLFRECFIDFENCDTNGLRKIEREQLKKRWMYLKSKFHLHQNVEFKINKAMEYLEKNHEQYLGVRTIHEKQKNSKNQIVPETEKHRNCRKNPYGLDNKVRVKILRSIV